MASQTPRLIGTVLADTARLRRPVTAAATAATIAAAFSPFGLNVGPDGLKITGALVLVGIVSGYIEKLLEAR